MTEQGPPMPVQGNEATAGEGDTPERQPHLRHLNANHYRAMELRLAGWSFDAIAAEVGVARDTVRRWFWSEPVFREEWKAIQQERLQRARALLVEVAPVAARTIAELTQTAENERVRLAAAQDVLDRTIGKAAERHEHSGPGGGPIPTAILPPEDVERQLRDLGLMDDE